MKTKKQRKITIVQMRAAEKKLTVLSHKQMRIAKQITPLKIKVRVYIQQNMEALEAHVAPPGCGHSMLRWAIAKIKRGYFGDATLGNLLDIIQALETTELS